MSENPENTGENRNPDGTFPKGADDAIRSAKRKLEAGEGLGYSLAPLVDNATRDREEAISKNVQKPTENVYRVPQGSSVPVLDGKLDDVAHRDDALILRSKMGDELRNLIIRDATVALVRLAGLP